MKRYYLIVSLFLISSCVGLKGIGSNIGWTDADPPVVDGVGRDVENNGGHKTLGMRVFQVAPEQLEILPSYGIFSSEEYNKYKAGAELAFKKATASADVEHLTSNLSSSSSWKVIRLKDFSIAALEKRFAFACITAAEYSYEVSGKTTAQLKADASEIATAFGVTKASVSIGKSPDKENRQKVVVKDPNVCLAFRSGKLTRSRWIFTRSDVPRNFDVNGSASFKLSPNEPGPAVYPDFGRRAKQIKPKYQIFAGDENGKSVLNVLIEDHDSGGPVVVRSLPETYPGVWQQSYRVHAYRMGNDIYGIISIDISAKRTADNKIEVARADLYSPEYKLVRD